MLSALGLVFSMLSTISYSGIHEALSSCKLTNKIATMLHKMVSLYSLLEKMKEMATTAILFICVNKLLFICNLVGDYIII